MSDLRAAVEDMDVRYIAKRDVLDMIPEGSVLVTEAELAEALHAEYGSTPDDLLCEHDRVAAAILARLRGEK